MNERQRRRERLRRRRRRRRIILAVSILAVLALVCGAVALAVHVRRAGAQRTAEGDIIVMSNAGTASAAARAEETTPDGNGTVNGQAGSGGGGTADGAANATAGAVVPGGSADASGTADGATDGSTAGSDGGASSLLTAAPLSQTIHLTEDQQYTGDLILVSKNHPYDFERNSETLQLVNIKNSQSYQYPVDKEEFQVAKRILKSLDAMIHDCDQTMGTRETGISSAYRTIEYQQTIWDETVDDYGEDYAEQYVAKPGCSEHHTGLAVDLGIFYDDGSYGTFSDSSNASWMAANCYKYGFIRRYAEDKVSVTGISNEAWHFRYVGIPHAYYMNQNNLCLEEYLSYLKENTSGDNPLTIEYDGGTAYVYYTLNDTIERPGSRYELSGDNCGGYVVTVYPK